MKTLIVELFSLLSTRQRKHFWQLQILVMGMSLFELVGIASIGPFMAVLANNSLIETNPYLAFFYEYGEFESHNAYLIALGLVVLVLMFLSTLISVVTTWYLTLFSQRTGLEIADRLYRYYLNQNWLFHASGSSAQLTKQLSVECERLTNEVIVQLLTINSRSILAILIGASLCIYQPLVALGGLFIFSLAYSLMFYVFKPRLRANGEIMSEFMTKRFRLMNEGFGGIKDVLILNRKGKFINSFEENSAILAKARSTNHVLSYSPRFLMEFVAFGCIVLLVLFLLMTNDNQMSQVLPIISVYALAGFKLLPCLQNIFFSLTKVKGATACFEALKPDLKASQQFLSQQKSKAKSLAFTDRLSLEHVNFAYPNKSNTLNNLSLEIKRNEVIGIVGSSGAGKSTIIDVFLGLIEPSEGSLKVDGIEVKGDNKHLWQSKIGFVPQSIFLSEGSILENVGFGLEPSQINMDQAKLALDMANLTELINDLEEGINTKVGERGVQLSGGQRQRIGIARALYHQPEILIFDEATSALDGQTEKTIMDAIHNLKGSKTIIMIAHRLKTIEACDNIFLIDKGEVVDEGDYQHLLENNETFKQMATHA